ncbi:MAG: 5-nucleotidase/2,3-cyclic phosphodiesterase [Phycisphaerales bacterium]|nr:5-nucleotidase/2,3-cyclic phosphodiesterase [Phycisphaerales bacterium]
MSKLTPRHRSLVSQQSRKQSSVLNAALETLEDRRLMTTTAPAYLVPTAAGVEFTPIITTGDAAPNGFRFAGTPDGIGAFDNGDGTFTVLVNHEFTASDGVAHTHNASLGAAGKGSYVDRLVIRKSDLAVLSGSDQIKTLLDGATFQPLTGAALNLTRFCSADLAAPSAYYNRKTGLGTTARLFLNGEETNNGRAFAHVVSGPNSGASYSLPLFNKYGGGAWENLLANPATGDATFVMANSDNGAGDHFNKVFAYLGTKQATGNEIQRAGLTNGHLFQISVPGVTAESDLFGLGNAATGKVLSSTFTLTDGVGTTFLRPEDGAWDPTQPNVYYFATTASFGGTTRLWRLTYTDLAHPELGGKIDAVNENPGPANTPGQAEMFDNITVNRNGDLIALEDVGNNTRVGKVWQLDASTSDLIEIGKHTPRLFDPTYVGPDKAFLTQDEESSGVIDVSSILGSNHYLIDVQAHYPNADPALVEGGQLLLLNTNAAKATLASDGALTITGTPNDDRLTVIRHAQTLTVTFNGQSLGVFNQKQVKSIAIDTGAGSDAVFVAPNIKPTATVTGKHVLTTRDAFFKGRTEDDAFGDDGDQDDNNVLK